MLATFTLRRKEIPFLLEQMGSLSQEWDLGLKFGFKIQVEKKGQYFQQLKTKKQLKMWSLKKMSR